MVSNAIDNVTCPKCGCNNSDMIVKFENDVYIVRDNDDFVRRKLYGCKKCKHPFTYDCTPRKESKNIKIQTAFSKISKQCDNILGNITLKT